MEKIKAWWNDFSEKYPKISKWVREGGMFYLFSNLVTVWQYVLLQFLPGLFSQYANIGWGWPNIELTLFDQTFTWNVIGYGAEEGGLAYLIAFLIATFTAQCINFPLQRNITFRSHGNPWWQGMWYFVAWVVVTFVVNSINCIWVAVAKTLVPDFIYNIVTIVMTGGISMVIYFFVFKIIFPEGNTGSKSA